MEPRNQNQQNTSEQGQHQNPLPQEITAGQKELNKASYDAAEADMEADTELTAHSPNDDLDEGESARLGENVSDII